MPRADPLHPPPAYGAARQHEPVVQVTLWNGQRGWLVTRYDLMRALLTDPRISADSSSPNFVGLNAGATMIRKNYRTFVQMDAPEHMAQRRLLVPEFSVRQIELARLRLEALASSLLDKFLALPQPADFVRHFALPLPSHFICELLGVPYDDHHIFQEWSKEVSSSHTSGEAAARLIEDFCEGYLARLVDEKIANPQDDLLGRLIAKYFPTGQLQRRDLISLSRLLLQAAHESTSSTISLGLLTLLQHPDQWRALQQDPSLVNRAVEEILRFTDVSHAGRRRIAKEDIDVAGQRIPAGDLIIFHNPTVNRDPAVFDDPDTFNIHRDATPHMAFGYGAHQCLGQPLGRMELRVAFGLIAARMPNASLAVAAEELRFHDDQAVYGVESLPLTW